MRQLAMDSARSTIANHAMRNWLCEMQLNLFVSTTGFLSVIGAILFFQETPWVTFVGVIAEICILTYWCRSAFVYRKLVHECRRALKEAIEVQRALQECRVDVLRRSRDGRRTCDLAY